MSAGSEGTAASKVAGMIEESREIMAKDYELMLEGQGKDSLARRSVVGDDEENLVDTFSVQDKTNTKFKTFGTQFVFDGYEIDIARYAISSLISTVSISEEWDLKILGDSTSSCINNPTTMAIETNVRERTVVYNDIIASFTNKKLVGAIGMIYAIFFPNAGMYRVDIVSNTKSGLSQLTRLFNQTMERSNFYAGKCLKFGRGGLVFVEVPTVTMENVILPRNVKEGFLFNSVNFLLNPEMHSITKKRGIILHGPPGTGKTSLVSAAFNELSKKDITCIYVTGESFSKKGFDETFRFIVKYLSPCLIVLEDFDLLAFDRNSGNRGMIGDILSWLNGIEEMQKPICVVGTTNRFDVLDHAATRPCRFDRHYKIDFPTKTELDEMWKLMVGTEPNGIRKYIGKVTGAHIREISNTAKMLNQDKDLPLEDCAEKALEEVMESFLLLTPKNNIGFHSDDGQDILTEVLPTCNSVPSVREEIKRKTGLG